MTKKGKTSIVIRAIPLLIALIIIIGVSMLAYESITNIQDYNVLSDKYNNIIHKYMEKPEFLKLIENDRNYIYCNESTRDYCYNCVNFTEDAIKQLKNSSYDVYRVHGTLNNSIYEGNHRWLAVKVYIEPTTGKIITPDKLKEKYKIKSEVKIL